VSCPSLPQHVRVRLDLQIGAGRGALDHSGEACRREGRPPRSRRRRANLPLPLSKDWRIAIGAERNLLSQTQTHAVRLGTSAAPELIPRLSK
jgi:hypothetical protein